jgi:branched-chain amino acid transport system substrate-binding protein
MKKWLVLTLIPLVLLFASAAWAQNEFKIGVITSLSGDLATGGNVTKRGYDLWAKEVNARGGIDIGGTKYKVKLIYADAQSQPAQAASAAERLAVQEKVDCVLGPYASGITLASAPVLEKYSIPMITGSAESPLIWLQKFRYTFGTIPPVNFNGSQVLPTLTAVPDKPKTAMVLGSNDAFSKATAEAFKNTAEKEGLKVLKFAITPQKQDLTPLMSAAKALRPDLVAFGGHDEELINLVKALSQVKYAPKALVMHYGVTEPAFVEALGKSAEGVLGCSVWTETLKTKGDLLWTDAPSYAKAALDEYKVPADYTQAGCTAAGLAYQAALTKLGAAPPLDKDARDKLVAVLEDLDIQTFYGQIKFAKEGEYYHANTGLQPLTVQIQDGKVVIVGPASEAEAELWYPLKPWDQR